MAATHLHAHPLFSSLRATSPALTPELQLWLVPADSSAARANDPEALGWPYWAFAWPGGQALARLLLDRPELVRGKTVLAFGAGGGLEALAAARSGASRVVATDVDPLALEALARNAALNAVHVEGWCRDVVDESVGADVLLVADACYEPQLAGRVLPWLRAQAARGLTVLLADPGRVDAVRALEAPVLGRYHPPFDGLDGAQPWTTCVWQLGPAAR